MATDELFVASSRKIVLISDYEQFCAYVCPLFVIVGFKYYFLFSIKLINNERNKKKL